MEQPSPQPYYVKWPTKYLDEEALDLYYSDLHWWFSVSQALHNSPTPPGVFRHRPDLEGSIAHPIQPYHGHKGYNWKEYEEGKWEDANEEYENLTGSELPPEMRIRDEPSRLRDLEDVVARKKMELRSPLLQGRSENGHPRHSGSYRSEEGRRTADLDRHRLQFSLPSVGKLIDDVNRSVRGDGGFAAGVGLSAPLPRLRIPVL